MSDDYDFTDYDENPSFSSFGLKTTFLSAYADGICIRLRLKVWEKQGEIKIEDKVVSAISDNVFEYMDTSPTQHNTIYINLNAK